MKTDSSTLEVIDPSEVLLSGPPASSLSPLETAAPANIEDAWDETRRLSNLIKDYSRASTAAKTLCGLRLRAIRTYHFGPRSTNGGRPRKTSKVGPFSSWDEMLAENTKISPSTADNWMKMADAVEVLALAEGTDIQSICRKLPHDWTPEDVTFLDATVQKLTQDKTQRQLLREDALSILGYVEPERENASNNPLGKNGGRKKPAANPQEKLEGLRALARTEIFGHDSKEHRPQHGSPAFWLNNLVEKQGKVGPGASPASYLSKHEREQIYELLLKPALEAWRALGE